MSSQVYDVLIVGGGVAGLTAGLYASRQGLKTIIVTIDVGGQLLISPRIENFPAAPPISGFELASSVLEQARGFGVEIVYDEVIELTEGGEGFKAKTRSGMEYNARSIILAVGKKPRKLGVPGEDKLVGRGVSYCAVCDAPLYRGKRVAIVGWGEQAYEAASILRNYDNDVLVIHSGKASPEELVRKFEELGVEVISRAKVEEIRGDLTVKALLVRRLEDERVEEVQVDGVFVELGYVTDTGWLKGFVELNDAGEIIVDKLCRTSREGVFAAGDVTDLPYKQAVIAAAQGAIAALSACNYIRKLMGKPEIRSDWRKLSE